MVLDREAKTLKYLHQIVIEDVDKLMEYLIKRHDRCDGGLNAKLVKNGNSKLGPEIDVSDV
eukprot:Pgem_evm1s16146